ncbi:MAG TPA: DoxX family protein [Candidatus Binatia bacterium]
MLATLLTTNGDWALTIARVVLGIAFFVHGAQKLFGWFGGHGLSATVHAFRDQMGIPAPLTYLAIAAEFFGGLGLILGLLARVAALGIAITMVVAMLKVHLKFGFLLNWFGNKPGHGIEYHLLAIALALVVIAHGAGAFSLDRVLYRQLASAEKVAFEFNLFVPFLFRVKPALAK